MVKKRKVSDVVADDITRVIEAGTIEEFKYFVSSELGFNVNFTKDQGNLAIRIAARLGRLDIVEFLLANGVDVDKTDEYGWTALYYAVKAGQLAVINRLIVEVKRNLNVVNKKGNTLLHVACAEANEAVVGLLLNALEKYPETERNLNMLDEWGDTPLIVACKRENKAVVRLLLNALETIPKNERYLNMVDKFGRTPLLVACERGNEAIISLLLNTLEKAQETERNLCIEDEWGRTPLLFAFESGSHVIVSSLLNALEKIPKTERILNEVNESGDTLLHVACKIGDEAIVSLLLNTLEKFPAYERCLNIVNKCGNTPLHLACESGNQSIVGSLLNALENIPANERCLSIVNKLGCSPLHLVCESRNQSIVRIFLNALEKIPETERNLNEADTWGDTILHDACQNEDEAVIGMLLNAGARPDIKNHLGHKALYSYLEAKDFNLGLLDLATLEKLAPYTDLNSCKMSLAHLIVIHGELNSLKIVLRLQKNLNVLDISGDTPLNYLTDALEDDIEESCNTIKLFINYGAYFNSKDCVRIVNIPSARNILFTDSELCAQSCLNKLVNAALPLLYDSPLSARLPPRERLISGYLRILKNCINIEIRNRGYCDFEKLICPLFSLAIDSLNDFRKLSDFV